EQVSVRIVLVLLAPGIAPVVDDLAAEQMPTDAPGVAVALRHQDLLAHLDRVEIDDLEGDMVDFRFEASRDEQRVMVARLVAAVEAHERPDRGSVLKAHHVRRKEAERVHIPAGAAVEIGRLEHEVAELRHLRRRQRRTLGVVDADRLVRSIVGNGRANRLRRDRSEAVMDADRDPQRVDEAYDGAPARPVGRFYGTARRLRQRIEVLGRGNGQPEADEAGRRAATDAIDVRFRAGAAQEEFALALRDDQQPEVDQIVPRLVQIGAFEMGVKQGVRLDDRRAAARQFDASGSLPDIGCVIHGRLLLGFGSGRDANVGGGQGGGEGRKDVEVFDGIESGGNEAVRADENALDGAALHPVGEGAVVTAERLGPGVLRGTVETDKAGAEGVEDGEIARRNYRRRIDPDAEGEPWMAAEEAIERRSALTR